MAAGMNELELPSFSIPDLFIPQKIPSPKPNNITLAPVSTATGTPGQGTEDGNIIISKSYVDGTGLEALPFASVEPDQMIVGKQQQPASYSSAVQAPPKRAGTPELDSSVSTVSTDESEDSVGVTGRSPTISKLKPVNANIVSWACELGLCTSWQ